MCGKIIHCCDKSLVTVFLNAVEINRKILSEVMSAVTKIAHRVINIASE